jgi:hypothetical protein
MYAQTATTYTQGTFTANTCYCPITLPAWTATTSNAPTMATCVGGTVATTTTAATTTTTTGGVSLVAPFAALAYVVAALF